MSDTKQIYEAERVKMLFSGELGEEVLGILLKKYGVFNPHFSDNAHLMAYEAGRKDVMLSILQMAEVDIARLRAYYRRSMNEILEQD